MIEMKNINKSFGKNLVLDDVDLTVNKGEILALIGENGAGKSTLMNILGGVLPANSGSIQIDGKKVSFKKPLDSLDAGIAFIHQELNLVNDLPIFENMFLGNEIMKNKYVPDMEAMKEKTLEIFERLEVDLDPNLLVKDLDASYKQIIEISKAMMSDAEYIIMDEPTTSLTGTEIERIFKMMSRLKETGVGIIFISHKLEEIMAVCDNYAVLRNGKMVANGAVVDTDERKLARHMVGHDVRYNILDREKNYGEEVLRVENLSNESDFRNINFSVKEGEVLGITGLLGDGRSELFLTLFGDMPHYTGDIYIRGEKVHIDSIQTSLKHKIGYLPRNRKENAIVKDLNILQNGTLVSLDKYLSNKIFVDQKKELKSFDIEKEKLNIKMEKHSNSIESLSGGNQQKVVLLKWLLNNPEVLILDNPTQGVDVGSKEEIYDIIHALAAEGVAIIVLSNEVNEIVRICDRSLVMYHGKIMGECINSTMNENDIMYLATGGQLLDEDLDLNIEKVDVNGL